MLVFGGLAGPQLMCRLELLSLSTLTYVTGPGPGSIYSSVYKLALECRIFFHYVTDESIQICVKLIFSQKISEWIKQRVMKFNLYNATTHKVPKYFHR